MRGIADSIARLSATATTGGARSAAADAKPLRRLDIFGSNPGSLEGFVHIPVDLASNAPLVVVLHGCTQSAAGYNTASGWSDLADEQGFALLFPEQQRANNANGCFNWFEPADTRRGGGEAASIRQMIAVMVERHAIDPRRIFVTGLSAGGAMAASMLAIYPEVFAGGAIIAGLAHGVASGMIEAFDRMRGHGLPSADRLAAMAREPSDRAVAWPRISIWHGGADRTVDVANAEAIGAQWRGLHGLPDRPAETEQVDGAVHRLWRGIDGTLLVEEYIVPGMGHGTPLKTHGADALGSSAPYMLDVGISSTRRIAAFWGLGSPGAARAAKPGRTVAEPSALPALPEPKRPYGSRISPQNERSPSSYVTGVIEDALRAAGLMH